MKRCSASFAALFTLCTISLHAGNGIWTTRGPEGGYITSLLVDPNNNNTLYAGAQQAGDSHGRTRGSAGIFKSTNQGKTWAPLIGSRFASNAVTSIVARSRTILFAGTRGEGVWISRNGGVSWASVSTPASPFVFLLAVDSAHTLYATTFNGVSVSLNGGASWTTNLPLPSVGLATDPFVPGIAYAGDFNAQLFSTSNSGITWQQINGCALPGFMMSPLAPIVSIAAGAGSSQPLYVGSFGGLFSASLAVPPCFASAGLPAIRFVVVADPNTSNVYSGSADGQVYTSPNAGTSWTALGGPLPAQVNTLAFDSQPVAELFAATLGYGVFLNRQGRWSARNTGLTAHDTYAVAVAASRPNTVYAATGNGGVFKSTNGGQNWDSVWSNTSDPGIWSIAVDPTNPDNVYAGTEATLYRSTNGGVTWTSIGGGMVSRVHSIVFDPTNPSDVYVGSEFGLFKSTAAGGPPWQKLTPATPSDANTIVLDPSIAGTIYIGTLANGVWKTTNSGAAWIPMNSGLTNLAVNSMTIRPGFPQILYAGTEGDGVFRSDNGGLLWFPVNGPMTNLNIEAVALDPLRPDTVYAGSLGDGVWRSLDAGLTWSAFNAGSPNPYVHSLAPTPNGDVVHAATSGSVYSIRP